VLIVETAFHDLSRGMPYALTIWLILVTLILAGCGLMVVPALLHRYRQRRARAEDARLRGVRLAAEAADLRRYAEEVAVAAARAGVTAHRREAEWAAVCLARSAAWEAFHQADTSAVRAVRAQAFPLAALAGAEERRARERYLQRAATEAYRRGDLAMSDLRDIVAGRNGWDPHRHPADHEVALRRLARDRRLAAYQAVAETERTTRYHADMAAAAARSLAAEADQARIRARRVLAALAADPRVQPATVAVVADTALAAVP
jgi:hypothetical protein